MDEPTRPPHASEGADDPTTIPGEGSSRREVLGQLGLAAGLATMAGFWIDGFGQPLRRRQIDATPRGAAPQHLTPERMATLEACVVRLLPGTGAADPGAREVNAAGYIDAILGAPWFLPKTRVSIEDGLDKLDARAKNEFGQPRFTALTPEQQDAAIRMFEAREAGKGWLRTMIGYVLEAFFGDPVHGINPDEIGWRWAAHMPGTPRPSTPNWELKPQ